MILITNSLKQFLGLRIYYLGFLICLLITSCKDSGNVIPKTDYTDAIQLKKGNFWVYESASIDLESGIRTKELNDSIFIKNDTVINDKVFYIVENLFGLKELKTKLAGNIIDNENHIEFSATNFTDTLYKDTNLLLYGMMKKVDEDITVPLGTFKTVMFIEIERNIAGHYHNTNPNNPSVYNEKYSYFRKIWYAKNIGIIKSVIYYGNSTGYEINLLRYRVNP